MSSSSSIISSGESEQRWAAVMEKHFDRGDIVVDMPFCVFRVPKSVSDKKPEAYAPSHLGLGPLHHLRPDLHAMNTHKFAAIAELLPPEKLRSFREAVVDALAESEAAVRGCYDQYLDLDIKTLAWILAVDGVYLIHYLSKYPSEMKHLDLAGDVLMLENQIPLLLLNKILQLLQLGPDDDRQLLRSFLTFFNDHSPLGIESGTELAKYDHLLHRMYFLTVNREPHPHPHPHPTSELRQRILTSSDVTKALKFLAERGLPGAGAAVQILSFTSSLPWEKISGLLKKDSPASGTDEIDFPSASQMAEVAGIRFSPTFAVRHIAYSESEKEFRLPVIKVNATTETVLRNLVAYEAAAAAPGATLPMAEYVDLMCGIIDTPKDVDILRKAGILKSQMADDKIAGIFNGITKSQKTKTKKDEVSNVEKAAGDVNAKFGGLPFVRFMKSAEKYGYGCFKVMSMVVTIAVVVLLTLQAYCSVFGCGRWFGNDDDVDVAALTQHPML